MSARIENFLKNALDKELDKDEKIAWVGVPDASKIFTAQDIFLIPFSLLWGGFAIFWETMVVTQFVAKQQFNPGTIIFPLWGIPFVAIGLYLIFGRFIVKRKMMENTIYGITNKRVIVLRLYPQTKVLSQQLTALGPITKSGNDEIGNLIFGESYGASALTGLEVFPSNGMNKHAGDVLGFFQLRRPREAYDIVCRAREITDKQNKN